MKKITLAIITSIVLTTGTFAQEVNITFENIASSDTVYISDGNVEFTGITEQVSAKIESDKIDAAVSLITEFGNDEDSLGITGYEIDTAYIEFRPVEMLSLDFNRRIPTEGSYLPVTDDNVGNGNLTSDFSVVLRPIENLSVAAGIKLPSVFSDSEDKIDLDAGVDYTTDLFSAGATVRSPINNFGFGVFGSFKGVENLAVNLGFAYNDDFCNVAGNLLTLGATYEISILTFGFDFVTNFGNDGNDLYTALFAEAGITDNLAIHAQATVNMDFADSNATETAAEIGAAYVIENHEIGASAALEITDSLSISFPIYYKYSF